MPYVHRAPPADPAALPAFLLQELPRIAQALQASEPARGFMVLYAPPEKYGVGTMVYADGATWDPGSGAGPYIYDGAAWVATVSYTHLTLPTKLEV